MAKEITNSRHPLYAGQESELLLKDYDPGTEFKALDTRNVFVKLRKGNTDDCWLRIISSGAPHSVSLPFSEFSDGPGLTLVKTGITGAASATVNIRKGKIKKVSIIPFYDEAVTNIDYSDALQFCVDVKDPLAVETLLTGRNNTAGSAVYHSPMKMAFPWAGIPVDGDSLLDEGAYITTISFRASNGAGNTQRQMGAVIMGRE